MATGISRTRLTQVLKALNQCHAWGYTDAEATDYVARKCHVTKPRAATLINAARAWAAQERQGQVERNPTRRDSP